MAMVGTETSRTMQRMNWVLIPFLSRKRLRNPPANTMMIANALIAASDDLRSVDSATISR